jgi:hypothetical protein
MHLKQASLLSKEGGAPQLLIATSVNIIDIIKKTLILKKRKPCLKLYCFISFAGCKLYFAFNNAAIPCTGIGAGEVWIGSICLGVCGYFQIITDYGFNLSATR